MTKDELVNSLQKRDPLLANAVSNMVDYISDRFPAAYPSKEQTESVNAIQVLDSPQLDRLQHVLDHIAYDKEYYMPERGFGMRR